MNLHEAFPRHRISLLVDTFLAPVAMILQFSFMAIKLRHDGDRNNVKIQPKPRRKFGAMLHDVVRHACSNKFAQMLMFISLQFLDDMFGNEISTFLRT